MQGASMLGGVGSAIRILLSIFIGWNFISAAFASDQIVYRFKGLAAGSFDPYQPEYGVVAGLDGNLYGTSRENGDGNQGFGNGAIYQVTLRVNHPAIERVIYKFKGGSSGKWPNGPLVFDADGNAYGVAVTGGLMSACNG